jgi:hypothetical protein
MFVIDTEQYAGNFERQMCAYITGQIGECGVGQEEAVQYKKETHKQPLDFIENRVDGSDDCPCMRPVNIYPTPGWFNHGDGGHFKDGQEAEALVDYRKAAKEITGGYIKQAKRSYWSEADKKSEIKRYEKKINDAMKLKKVHKWPAYLSVAIFCSRKPTDKEIDFMKERAKKFAAISKIKVTGFRLVEEKIESEATAI